MRFRRYEISTIGPDAGLQLVGSDAQGGSGWTGLPIPAEVQPARYSFLLASAEFGGGERARLVGLRQYVEIGLFESNGEGQALYPQKRNVVTPFWRFVDGNVMWSLRRLPPTSDNSFTSTVADGLAFRQSKSPAQLYETLGPPVTPPYGGILQGMPLEPNLYQFYDVRFPWDSNEASSVLSTPIEGPCTVALFASVLQTNPSTRVTPPSGATVTVDAGATPEEAFLKNFPSAIYTRIAGALIFEEEYPAHAVPDVVTCPPAERPAWAKNARAA